MAMLISIDNGGTLTDACVIYGARAFHAKALTTPHDLTQCFVEVLREVSRRIYGEPKLHALFEEVDYIRYSTTQGTNAVVQRKGPRLGLVLRHGQSLQSIVRNEHEAELAQALVGDRIATLDLALADGELDGNVISVVNDLMSRGANRLVVSLGGPQLVADESRVKRMALQRYPRHLLGAVPILYSHRLSDDADDGRRTWSSLLNAFLHPAMERFLYNAEGVLREYRTRNPLLIFCNDGTSSRVAKTVAIKTWGSGPRGGMEGAKALARHYGRNEVLTMDIGGTTTDIGLIRRGEIGEQRWGSLEDVQISFPLSEVDSLGIGGGSIFRVDGVNLTVGPESVGGAPGPACFGYGGREATMTDAYLLLGLLDASSYFGGGLQLDAERAKAAVTEKVAKPLELGLDEALLRMEQAYIEKIARPLSRLGSDAAGASLLAFGGAGPMSACRVADALGVKEIIVPQMAAVFSAFGIGFSDIAHTYEGAVDASDDSLRNQLDSFKAAAQRDMFAEGFDLSECSVEKSISFSLNGEQASRRLNGDAAVPQGLRQASDLRVQLRATKAIPHFVLKPIDTPRRTEARAAGSRSVRLPAGGRGAGLKAQALPLFKLAELGAGEWSAGPCVVEEEYFTCLVTAGWEFLVNDNHDLVLRRGA